MTTGGPTFSNRTIRMVVHPSIGGSGLRIRLSDQYSGTPLHVGAVDVALQATGGAAVPGTHHRVTFAGSGTVTIAPHAELASDVIDMSVDAGQNLLVSTYLPGTTDGATWHSDAFDHTYLSVGNHTAENAADNYGSTTTSWYYLDGVDVVSPTARGTVVAFGDSITDGYASSTGTYHRWPDFLAGRIGAKPGPQRLGVVDAGIGGNRVLTDVPNLWQGVSALKRFGHDALGQPGVRDVILMEGINDIGNNAGPNGAPLTAQDLINGYQTLINQAHAAGVNIIGGTMMPCQGNGYYTPERDALRNTVNNWIRNSGAFDGVVDFDLAMRDANNPAAINPAYDSGDHLHPNDAGMRAMADAVDLRLLQN
jgi:lysophospholipase L1-like esterase